MARNTKKEKVVSYRGGDGPDDLLRHASDPRATSPGEHRLVEAL